MKKTISVLTWLLFALTILHPTGSLITACFGYTFELISISVFAIIISALYVSIVAIDPLFKSALENKTMQILLTVMTPLSLINSVFYIFKCPKIWVIANILISVGCCCCLAIKHVKPLTIKIVALTLSAVMALPIGFFSFISLIFGNFGQNTVVQVVQTVESPTGKYYAQVIDSDQGALGGDTLVDVYSKNGINAILFKVKKNPQRVYWGEWGEFENMQIYWKDDDCLIINSVEYEIE